MRDFDEIQNEVDGLVMEVVTLLENLDGEERKAGRAGVEVKLRSGDHVWPTGTETVAAWLARRVCREILNAGNCDGMSGCPLCQS